MVAVHKAYSAVCRLLATTRVRWPMCCSSTAPNQAMASASRLLVGSSNNSSGVSLRMASASFNRCFMPLLKCDTCLCKAFSR